MKIFLLLVLSFSLFSCSGKAKKGSLTSQESFDLAFSYYKKGKYEKAIQEFTIVSLNFAGSNIADDAQFYLAECYFETKQYLLAESEYKRLTYDYPNSEFIDDAEYKVALSLYLLAPKNTGLDITDLEKAMVKFQEFLESYPQSSLVPEIEKKIRECRYKLSKKMFENGETYRKMGLYESALVYYDFVLKNYYDTELADDSQYRKGYSLLKDKKYAEAKKELEIFLEKYKNSVFTDEAKQKLNQTNKELAKEILR
ncbi:outer membrane protein assembly factor BamD [bacterium]|nr:outer membrane protein assembly factor BamD [bacterium]